MSQSMNNCERAEMLRLMAEELKDSISAYEGAEAPEEQEAAT